MGKNKHLVKIPQFFLTFFSHSFPFCCCCNTDDVDFGCC